MSLAIYPVARRGLKQREIHAHYVVFCKQHSGVDWDGSQVQRKRMLRVINEFYTVCVVLQCFPLVCYLTGVYKCVVDWGNFICSLIYAQKGSRVEWETIS